MSEFVSRDLDLWAYQRGVTLDFSRPGKPTDNGFIESFNAIDFETPVTAMRFPRNVFKGADPTALLLEIQGSVATIKTRIPL